MTVGVLLHLLGAEGGVHVDPLPLVFCLHMLPALHVKPCIPFGVRVGVRLRFDWGQVEVKVGYIWKHLAAGDLPPQASCTSIQTLRTQLGVGVGVRLRFNWGQIGVVSR